MDVSTFFARFVQPAKEETPGAAPDDLGEFERVWTAIQETLAHPDERQLVRGIVSTEVPAQLKHIVDALVYESNRGDENATGVCLEYFLNHDLLSNLERLCESDRPHGIKAEVVRAINSLVVLLSERFLVHNAVHRPLRRLLRSCVGEEREDKVDGAQRIVGAGAMERDTFMGNEDLESDLVDLMCILCSRMRAYPPLLLIFFHDKGWLQPDPQAPSQSLRPFSPTPSSYTTSTRTSKPTHRFEFLLFSYLLRFVHREGRIGEFARTGLLFLFDMAFSVPDEENATNLQDARDALGEFILDGDFAEVMAAGLGAIFSLLPSKLSISALSETDDGGMHLGQMFEADDNLDAHVRASDEDVRDQLDLLLKMLQFLQDIIQRCHSPVLDADPDSSVVTTTHLLGSAIVDSILDAIQTSFLENVLYPSILECSPLDGSSTAVLTYLDTVFSNLDDGPLLFRILDFLMDTHRERGFQTEAQAAKPKKKTGAMAFVSAAGAHNEYFADEGRFTLKDLIVDNGNAPSWRLLATLVSQHCRYTRRGLLTAIRIPMLAASPATTPGEMELYTSLLGHSPVDYTTYLADFQSRLATDPCFLTSNVPVAFGDDGKIQIGKYDRDPFRHRLNATDTLLGRVMASAGNWFANSPEENVALTGVVSALGLCCHRSLEGWILAEREEKATLDPWNQAATSDPDTDSDSFSIPHHPATSPPPLYTLLVSLFRLVSAFRAQLPDSQFDKLLSERRRGLLFTDHLDEAMNIMLDVGGGGGGGGGGGKAVYTPATPSPRKKRPSAMVTLGSIKSFLTPKKKAASASATPTPDRGEAGLGTETETETQTSPFKDHYSTTMSISLLIREPSVLGSEERDGIKDDPPISDNRVRLTVILDNCVVLEEFVKEILGMIMARRAAGIDLVEYF